MIYQISYPFRHTVRLSLMYLQLSYHFHFGYHSLNNWLSGIKLPYQPRFATAIRPANNSLGPPGLLRQLAQFINW